MLFSDEENQNGSRQTTPQVKQLSLRTGRAEVKQLSLRTERARVRRLPEEPTTLLSETLSETPQSAQRDAQRDAEHGIVFATLNETPHILHRRRMPAARNA